MVQVHQFGVAYQRAGKYSASLSLWLTVTLLAALAVLILRLCR